MRMNISSIHRAPAANLGHLLGLGDTVVPQYIPPPAVSVPVQFGNTTTMAETLESRLQSELAELTAPMYTLTYQGPLPDFQTQFEEVAQNQCANWPGLPDCANMAALVATYTALAQQAWSGVAVSSGGTVTAYQPAAPPTAPISAQPVQAAAPPPPPAITAATILPAPASPPAGSSTTASGSGSSSTSSSGSTTSTDFLTEESVAGIPNWVWLAGAAALAGWYFMRKP